MARGLKEPYQRNRFLFLIYLCVFVWSTNVEFSSVTLFPKIFQSNPQLTDVASLTSQLVPEISFVCLPGLAFQVSLHSYLALTQNSRDPKSSHLSSLRNVYYLFTARWTDDKMLTCKQCNAHSQAQDQVERLTCWKLQAVAAHRGPELLHQNDTLMVQGSLQHRYDRHGYQKETQLGNPVHRKPVTNSILEGSVSKSL